MSRIYKPRAELLPYEVVSEEARQRHMVSFVNSFVVKRKQERWLHLLIKRPEKVRKTVFSLYEDLNKDICYSRSIDNLINADNKIQKGVYYEFSGKAHWIPFEDVRTNAYGKQSSIGYGNDALYSIEEGKFAVFFFHEYYIDDLVCKN